MNLGKWAEGQVKQILINHGWSVNDANQPHGHRAPLYETPQGNRIAPDFTVWKGRDYNPRCVEVKAKRKGARKFGIAKEYRHGVEQPQYDHYRKVQDSGIDVWLFIYEGDTGDLLRGKIGDLDVVQRTEKLWPEAGGAVLFRRDDFDIVPVAFDEGQTKIDDSMTVDGGLFGEEEHLQDQAGINEFAGLGQCEQQDCIDDAVTRVRFGTGEEREYCKHHADHIGPEFDVEVIRADGGFLRGDD